MTIKEYKELRKVVLGVLEPEALNAFNAMSLADQEEYVKGFIDCLVALWTRDNSDASTGKGGGNGTPPPVRQWKPKGEQGEDLEGTGSSSSPGMFEEDEEDANKKGQEAKEAGQESSNDGEITEELELNGGGQTSNQLQKAAESALNAANAALRAADAALKMANKAKEAANGSSGSSSSSSDGSGLQSAGSGSGSGSGSALAAADRALAAADRALAAADRAKAAAAAAQNTSGAELAKHNDDAGEAAWEAGQAAQEAAAAAADARNAGEQEKIQQQGRAKGDKTGKGWEGNEKNSNYDLEGGVTKASTPAVVGLNDSIDRDMYGPMGESANEVMKRLAQSAGVELDSDDTGNIFKYEDEKFQQVKLWAKQLKSHGRGTGNSLSDMVQYVEDLFDSTIDWRSELKHLFNAYNNSSTIMNMHRRKFGVDADHPWYSSRYILTNPKILDEKGGLIQVMIMIDNSGSMQGVTGNGHDVFDNIISEIIELEHKTHIQKSALTYFADNNITRDLVRVWTYKDTKNVWDLVNLIKRRPGDNTGGTSFCRAFALMQAALPKSVFTMTGPKDKRTLLLVVTDGEDMFTELSQMVDQTELQLMVFIVINNDDKFLKLTKDELTSLGIQHVITINQKSEW